MKLTQTLYKQHINRLLRYIWQTQRERPVQITKAEDVLSSMGYSVQDALETLTPKREFKKIEVHHLVNKHVLNEHHPEWKDRACLICGDNNLLQQGTDQAYLLTNTLKISDTLPEEINNLFEKIPSKVDTIAKRIVSNTHIYDTQQVKLPKIKDPNRPMWVFPRKYGITSTRKMLNVSRKFLQLCESLSEPNITRNRIVAYDGVSSICIENDSHLIQFNLKMDLMLISKIALNPINITKHKTHLKISNFYPLHHTIGLPETNIYNPADLYPINPASRYLNVHTIFINYDPEEVKNITELPTTEDQIYARSLIKSFAAAASRARQKYGESVKTLPEPIVVQCVQSDGQNFHFSVYQLNTLDMNIQNDKHNYWWSIPSMKLYEKAEYENGRPFVVHYNPDVFNTFLAFYKNS